MYKKILVPLDGSELAECVLSHVEAITKGPGTQNIIFARVVQPFQLPTSGAEYTFTEEDAKRIDSESRSAAEDYLKKLVSRVKYGQVKVQSKALDVLRRASLTTPLRMR